MKMTQTGNIQATSQVSFPSKNDEKMNQPAKDMSSKEIADIIKVRNTNVTSTTS